MQYCKATNKHALDLCLLTGKGPHHREKLSPATNMCVLLKARKSYGNKYLKLLTLITSRGVNLRVKEDQLTFLYISVFFELSQVISS